MEPAGDSIDSFNQILERLTEDSEVNYTRENVPAGPPPLVPLHLAAPVLTPEVPTRSYWRPPTMIDEPPEPAVVQGAVGGVPHNSMAMPTLNYQADYAPPQLIPLAGVSQHNVSEASTHNVRNTPYIPGGDIIANEVSPSHLEELDAFLLAFLKEQGIPGASLVITRRGEPFHTQCYGWASLQAPLRPHHLFRIGSISKILTAIAAMRLVQDSKLKLSDKIFGPKGLLPHYSPLAGGDKRLVKITVRHLLQHSGGWDRDVVGDPCFWTHVAREMGTTEPADQHTLISYMMSQKLQFVPGTRYCYSNLGYLVLGRVIEVASGQSYEGYVRSLLAEIGITRMWLGKTHKAQSHSDEVEYFACPQRQSVKSVFPGGGQVPAPYGGYSMEVADSNGGWVACPTDLVKIFNVLEGYQPQKLLKPETFKLMFERPKFSKGSSWYGLGLDISWNRKAWEHGGHIDGATGVLTRDRHCFTWALLCNYWPADTDYTSLVAHAIMQDPMRSPETLFKVPYADIATPDENYLIKLKLPANDLQQVINHFDKQDYVVCWVNGYQVEDNTFFNLVFKRPTYEDEVKFLHGLSGHNVHQAIEDAASKMYTPVHIDTYIHNGRVCMAVILSKEGPEKWLLYQGLSKAELQSTNNAQKENGYTVCCQSVLFFESQIQAAVLYEESDDVNFWSACDLTDERYDSMSNRQTLYGHMLSYIKVYEVPDGEVRYSVVWTIPDNYLYTAERGMSQCRLLNDFVFAAQKKFIPLCVCGYGMREEDADGTAHRFAAVCVKPLKGKRKTD